MLTADLKKRLIEKIQKTDNASLLRETLKLFESSEEDDLYELSAEQRDAINEGRGQIKSGHFLTDAQADKEIEEWLAD